MWYSLSDMRRQLRWSGNKLVDTGLLVGPDQLDKPQEQFRTIILPPDPRPRINPRPSPNITPVTSAIGQPKPTSPENGGFTVFTLGLTVTNAGFFTLDQSVLGGPDVLAGSATKPFTLDQSQLDGPDALG
jgi:hypothetical protein